VSILEEIREFAGGPSFAIGFRMARRPRPQFPGAVYHVMSRGNRKSVIFDTDDDRRRFLNTLGDAALTYQARVYAACLMGTHYHILLDTPRGNLSAMMRQLNGVYSQDRNRRRGQTGHTFEARFHSIVVQRERYLRHVARYVVLNPVKAQLCADAASWTTYRATAGLEAGPSWLYVDWIDWAFRAASRNDAQDRYRQYVNNNPLRALQVDERTYVLGTARFQRSVLSALGELPGNRPLPRFCRAAARPPLETLFLDVEADCHSRDAAVRVAHVSHGYPLAEIAAFLGMDPSTASKALRRARRDQVGEPPHDS
jgi:REP element-mobilizing transposase RayT